MATTDIKHMTAEQFREYQDNLLTNRHWRHADDLAARRKLLEQKMKEEEERRERIRFWSTLAIRAVGIVAFYKVMMVLLIPGAIDLIFFAKAALAAAL